MRKALVRACVAFLAVLMVTGLLAPVADTRAASSAAPLNDPRLTATVVGPPSSTLPAIMLVQLGSQTLSVSITAETKLERHFGGVANLAEFADGDMVDISGDLTQTGIAATRIINLSVQAAYTNLQGTISAINPAGAVPTVITLTNLSALGGKNAPYPSPLPSQINLPVSAATTITIGGNTQPAGSLIGQLNVNDTVTAVGVYDRVTNQFDAVTNIKKAAAPPPLNLKVTAILEPPPSTPTSPPTLCVKSLVVTSMAIRPNVSQVSPCPSGQLPVSVTGATKIIRLFHGASSLIELSQGDTLVITGTLANGVLTADTIQDNSIDEPTIQGGIQSITANGNVTDVVIAVTSGNSANAAIPSGKLTTLPLANSTSPNCAAPSSSQFPCTVVTVGGASTNGYNAGELSVGQAVTATGVWNSQLNQFLYIAKVSGAAPPPPVTLHQVGTFQGTANPTTLCMHVTSVTAQAIRPNISTVSPCPSGQGPVYITSATKFQRLFNEGSSLAELSQGDALQVTGSLVNFQFTASLIVDTSIHLPTVTGIVQSVSAPSGNVTNVVITVTGYSGGGTPLAKGSQVTLPLFNSSSPNCTAASASQLPCTIVQTSSGTTNGYNAGELTVSQTVSAIGVYNTQLQRFIDITSVKASVITPPPPVKVRVQGILAANPTQLTGSTTLCLRGFYGVPRADASTLAPGACQAGQLAVNVTSSTRIVRRYYGGSGLDQLNQGDTLQVTGLLANGQVAASLVRDLSIQDAYSSLVGAVGFVNFNNPQYFTVRVTQNSGRHSPFRVGSLLPIYVNGNTQIVTSSGTSNQITVLNPGQTVTVLGVYNRHRHAFTYTFRVRVH